MTHPTGAAIPEKAALRRPPDYKIFCDESCHLEHDRSNVMVLGALRCRASEAERITRAIKFLRHQHGYHTELKWTKLIAHQLPFYQALIDLFLSEEALRFKAAIVQNKHLLNHDHYNAGSHNTFYYKMAYYALRDFLTPGEFYRIYLDYMDTLGATKAAKLAEVLDKGMKSAVTVETYVIRSHESQLIQLCDLLIGAISYANRDDIPKSSIIKTQVVKYLEERFCRSLQLGTPPWEEKFNLFMFSPRGKKC